MKARFLAVAALAGAAVGSIALAACGVRSDGGPSASTTAPDEAAGRAEEPLSDVHRGPLLADGLPPGMARFRGGPQQAANPVCASPKLTYFGGPLLQSPTVVTVFWTGSVNATAQANMAQFYADVTVSSYWSWLHEYDSVGLAPGTNQAILPGTSGGSFVIAPLKCAPGGNGCKLSDVDLQNELTRQINLGVLPAPTLDCTGNVNTVYMVDFPPNISLGGPQGAGRSCVNNGFCGYHNTGTYGASNLPLIYAALMDVFTGPCSQGCGGNAKALDNATSLASHELAESATDADIGLDVQAGYALPAGWGDNNNQCGEIGDICDDGSPGDTITVGGRSWVVQPLWSNAQGKCASSGTALAICAGTTVTGCRKCSCGDDGLSCSGSTSVCETTASNVLLGGCEQCTASSGNCGAGTCQQSATPAQDDLCSNCVPLKACPAADACGTASDGCGGTLSCGSCTPPQTCGGGTPSNPNQCGCTPLKACPPGDTCGTVPDGCGGVVSCGACALPQTCGGGSPSNPNQCGCSPLKSCPAGDTCGTLPDGCGGIVACGTCTLPQICGGGMPSNPNQCGCTPMQSCGPGDSCGTVPDGCGGTVSCGTCAVNEVCSGNQCIAQIPDAGSDSGMTTTAATSSTSVSTSSTSSSSGGTTTTTSSTSSTSSSSGGSTTSSTSSTSSSSGSTSSSGGSTSSSGGSTSSSGGSTSSSGGSTSSSGGSTSSSGGSTTSTGSSTTSIGSSTTSTDSSTSAGTPSSSGTSATAGAGGAGGSGGGSSSGKGGGAGTWPLFDGRACECVAAPGVPAPIGGWVGLAGLAGLAVRRRRATR